MSPDIYDDLANSYLGAKSAPKSDNAPQKLAGYSPLNRTSGDKKIDAYYEQYGREYDVDPNLLFEQGWQESKFKNNALSHKGALGPAQFMPDTAREFNLRVDNEVDERLDPTKAIPAQAKLMRKLLDRTNDVGLSLAGYNSGHNYGVDQLRRNMERIAETKDYVARITKKYGAAGSVADPYENLAQNYLSAPKPANSQATGDAYDNLAANYLNKSVPGGVQTNSAQTPQNNPLADLTALKTNLEASLKSATTQKERREIAIGLKKLNQSIAQTQREKPFGQNTLPRPAGEIPGKPVINPVSPTFPNPSLPKVDASVPQNPITTATAEMPERLKFPGGELLRENGNIYTNAGGEKFEITKTADGYTGRELNPKLVLGAGDEQLTQTADQSNVPTGKVRVSGKNGDSFLATAKADKTSFDLELERSAPAPITEEDYKIYFAENKQTDTPENRKAFNELVAKADAENFGKRGEIQSAQFNGIVGANNQPITTATPQQQTQPKMGVNAGVADPRLQTPITTGATAKQLPQQSEIPRDEKPTKIFTDFSPERVPANKTLKEYASDNLAQQISATYGIEIADVIEAQKDSPIKVNGAEINESDYRALAANGTQLETEVGTGVVKRAREIGKQRAAKKQAAIANLLASGDNLTNVNWDELNAQGINEEDVKAALTGDDPLFSKAKDIRRQIGDAKDKGFESYQKALLDTGQITQDTYENNLEAEREAKARAEEEVKKENTKEANYSPTMGKIAYSDSAVYKKPFRSVEDFKQKNGIFSFTDFYEQKDREEAENAAGWEKAAESPNLVAVEFLKNLTRTVPKAVSAISKTLSIGAEAIDAATGGSDQRAASERGFFELGKWIDRQTDAWLPQDKILRRNFIATTLPDTLGQLVVQIALGAGTGGVAAPVLLGASMGASAQYEEAERFQASKGQRLLSAFVGGLAAVPDALLLTKWLKPLSGAEKTGFISKFLNSFAGKSVKQVGEAEAISSARLLAKNILVGGLLEGTQEVSENKINDALASMTYDPKRKVLVINDKDIESFLAGFVGGGFGGTIQTLGEKRSVSQKDYELGLKEEYNGRPIAKPSGDLGTDFGSSNENTPTGQTDSIIGAKVETEVKGKGKRKGTVSKEIGANNVAVELEDGSVVQRRKNQIEIVETPTAQSESGSAVAARNQPKSDKKEQEIAETGENIAETGENIAETTDSVAKDAEKAANPGDKSGTPVVTNRREQVQGLSFEEDSLDTEKVDDMSTKAKENGASQTVFDKVPRKFNENSATDAANDAALSPLNDLPEPTEAQKEAGNYKKGHISIGGLNLSIENPVGSERKGVERGGKPWSVKMNHHYGYIKNSVGADKEHIDVFVKDETPKDFAGDVFVIDQVDPKTGAFDEHKVMLGYETETEARRAYLSNYTKDWKGLGKITAMPAAEFKDWAVSAERSKPISEERTEGESRKSEVLTDAAQTAPESENPAPTNNENTVQTMEDVRKAFESLEGGGITEDIRNKLWEKVERGDTTELGQSSNILVAAQKVRIRGGLQNRADFERFSKDYFDSVAGLRGAELQTAGNDLIEKYAPKTTDAPIKKGEKITINGEKFTVNTVLNDSISASREMTFQNSSSPQTADITDTRVFGKETLEKNGYSLPEKVLPETANLTTDAEVQNKAHDIISELFDEKPTTYSGKNQKVADALKGLAGILGDDILLKAAVLPESNFDEAQYQATKPLLKTILDEIGDPKDDTETSLRKIITTLKDDYGLSKDGVMRIVPFMSKFLLDAKNNLQSDANESKNIAEAKNDVEPINTDRDSQRSDADESSAIVQRTDDERRTGDVRIEQSGERTGNDAGADARSDGQIGDDGRSDAVGSGTNASQQSGERNSDSAGDRVSNGNSKLDYSATVGSLTREGSWRETAKTNLDILELVKTLEKENRLATPAEQKLLVKFTGWGASDIANNLFPGAKNYGEIKPEYARDGWKDLAQRAKDLFTPEELQTALRSTQYAHYTSEKIVRGIWDALKQFGFNHGKILEPGMGTGLFGVAAPRDMFEKSRYTGIEMDKLTASVAKQILQNQAVISGDFVKQKLPNDFFDVAIGNPPFSSTKILDDPAYKKYRFLLHDYFFAKSIDKVRPGGLLVFVTSKGTMDKGDQKMREYIAEKADLLGAVRLPQTAFKQNAGTEVVTDVIFLRKRLDGETPAGENWIGRDEIEAENKSGEKVKGLINEYFVKFPEMVLGKNSFQGSMYRANEYTVEPLGGDIGQQFREAIEKLPTAVYANIAKTDEIVRETAERDWNPVATKEGSLYLRGDGTLMRREMGSGVYLGETEKISANDEKWLKDYVGLRISLKTAQFDQLNEGEWEKSLQKLNEDYNAFVKKHGNIVAFTSHERTLVDADGVETTKVSRRYKNSRLLAMDVESPLIRALERITEDNQIVKSAMLEKRTIKRPSAPEIKTLSDALAVSLDKVGNLNLAHVAEIYKPVRELSKDEIISELGDAIYESPSGGYQLADDYLSGYVIDKLEEAQAAAASERKYDRNVKALLAVQPKQLEPMQINVGLGAAWVSPGIISDFANEIIGIGRNAVSFDPISNIYSVEGAEGSGSRSNRTAAADWGTADRSPQELLDTALNNKSIRITYKSDGKTVVDEKASAVANELVKKMRDTFRSWVWTDAKRAAELTEKYNRLFNNIAPRTFDGSHLSLPGLSAVYKLHNHQMRAVWRILQSGNTYLAHAVGAGKTLEMIVSGMEQKRLGLINKPMYVVPNHMLNQFASEFLDAYPMANILVADEKNFHKENRRRFVAQAALNDLDAIVLTHSAFGLLRTKAETSAEVVDDMISQLNAVLGELDENDRAQKRTIKKLEARKETIERRFYGKQSDEGRDDVVDFEDLGVDFLYVDEAHEFRKLDFVTNRDAVKGITPEGSRRALDLLIKMRWLDKQRPGRSAVLASGTPVTNTLAELYTIQRYLDNNELEAAGISHFDAWANQFGEVVGEYEMNAAGNYELVERFSKFINIPELMKRVRKFMDVLTLNQLGSLVDLPTMKGGAPQVQIVPATEATTDYLKNELDTRIKISRDWKPSKDQPGNPDPLINIITDGRLSAIDMRFVDPTAGNDPNSKLNLMIDKIIENYNAHKNLEFRSKLSGELDPVKGAAQIVFSAVGFGEAVAASRGFDAKKWIIKRLTTARIPASEIAFMSDYKTAISKEAMFQEMRQGTKRILIGSPKNMGTGVNVQKRLKNLEFLSPPWYPADVEQPDGRILRQGNQNDEIEITRWATKGTYDSTAWAMIARKSRAIEQAMTGDDSQRSLEDVSESSNYEMASALAAGDGRAIALAGLRRDVEKLKRLKDGHFQEQQSLSYERGRTSRQIETGAANLEKLTDAVTSVGGYVSSDNFNAQVGEQIFTKRTEIGDAIKQAFADKLKTNKKKLIATKTPMTAELGKGQGKYPVSAVFYPTEFGIASDLIIEIENVRRKLNERSIDDISELDSVGLSTRIYNVLNNLAKDRREAESNLAEARRSLKQIESKIGRPFAEESDLYEKIAEYSQLQKDMAGEAEENAAENSADIGKENSQPPDDAADLFKRIEETEYYQIREEKTAALVEKATFTREGKNLKLNIAGQEILRRAQEQHDLQTGVKKLGDYAAESSFSGVFINPETIKNLSKILRAASLDARTRKLNNQSEKLNKFADEIEGLAKDSKNTLVAYTDAKRIPHEIFHQKSYIFALAKHLTKRHRNPFKLSQMAETRTAYQTYFSRFPEYTRYFANEKGVINFPFDGNGKLSGKLDSNQELGLAIIREEMAAYIAGGEGALLGLSEDQEADYMIEFFKSYVERNAKTEAEKNEILDHFGEDNKYVQKLIQQFKNSVRVDGEGASDAAAGSGESLLGESPENSARAAGSDESTSRQSEGGENRTGQKLRSLPETLRENGIAAEDDYYDVVTDEDAKRAAREILEKGGISEAIRVLKNTTEPDAVTAQLGFMVAQTLEDSIADATNDAEAAELRKIQSEITSDLAKKFTKAGQFISAARVVRNSPVSVVISAQAILKAREQDEDALLSPEQLLEFEDLGKKSAKAHAALEKTRRDLVNERAKNKRLQDKLDGKTTRRTAGARKARESVVQIIKKKHGEAVADKLAGLRTKFNPPVDLGLNKRIESDFLKRVEETEETSAPLDAETLSDLAEVGALYLTEGIAASDQVYLPDYFHAQMTADFGKAIAAQMNEIYYESMKIRDKWLKEARFEQNKKRLQGKAATDTGRASLEADLGKPLPEVLTDADVYEILQTESDYRRKRNAVEKAHRLISGAKRTNATDELTRTIAELAGTEEIAAAAKVFADGTSDPKSFYRQMNALGIDAQKSKILFVKGKQLFAEAKAKIAEHYAEIKEEIVKSSDLIQEFSDEEWRNRKAAQKAQDAIADEFEKLQKGKFRKTVGAIYGGAFDLSRNLNATGEASFMLKQAGRQIFAAIPRFLGNAAFNKNYETKENFKQGMRTLKVLPRILLNDMSFADLKAGKFADAVSWTDDKAFGRIMQTIEADPVFVEAVKMKITFSSAGKMGMGGHVGEEQLNSSLTEYIMPVRRFDNAMSGFLDYLRLESYKRMRENLIEQGMTPKKNEKEFIEIAKEVNRGTGRANRFENAKGVQSAIDAISKSNLAFAISYTVSKYQMIGADAKNVAEALGTVIVNREMPKGANREIVKNAAYSYGALSTRLALMALAFGATLSFDPDDDDFLKFKWGNYRYDGTFGFQSELRFIFRLMKSVSHGNRVPGEIIYDVTSTGGKYVRNKLNVLPQFVYSSVTGKDAIGQEFSLSDWTRWARLFVPITWWNLGDGFNKYGLRGVGAQLPELIGVNTAVYPERAEEAKTEAEKLALKIKQMKKPPFYATSGEDAITKETWDVIGALKKRARGGENVQQEVNDLVKSGKIPDSIGKDINSAGKFSMLEEFLRDGKSTDAEIKAVWDEMTETEKEDLRPFLEKRLRNKEKSDKLDDKTKAIFDEMKISDPSAVDAPEKVTAELDRLEIKTPDVGRELSLKPGEKTKMSEETYTRYRREVLEKSYQAIERAMSLPNFSRLDDKRKKMQINRAIAVQRKMVQEKVRNEMRKKN